MVVDMVIGDDVTVTARASGARHPECGSHSGASPEISKFGHGGPRKNSGGARANAGRPASSTPASAPKPPSAPKGQRWYCLQTPPRGELLAILSLTHRGFPTFLPLHMPGAHQVLRPLFPGWLFVQFDHAAGLWGSIKGAPGVRELHSASPLEPGFVAELIRLYGPGGPAVLPEKAVALDPIERGQVVRVADGRAMDLVGICDWSDREKVALLAEVMGGHVRIVVPRRSVVEVPAGGV
jgi:transcriptional antiterminator RfaH